MKNRLLLLLVALTSMLTGVQAQKYQMDVTTKGGEIASYLVNDLKDVTYKDTMTIITLANKATKIYSNDDLLSVSWSEFKGTETNNGGTFFLDENRTSVSTPNYAVRFLAGSLTGETKLTVNKVNDAPSIIKTGVDEMVVYDFTLDKPANFDGVAEIRIPMKAEEGDMVFGSYYDPTLKDWDAVVNYYDEESDEVVISTKHFSRFGIFRIVKQKATHAKLQLLAGDKLVNYIAKPAIGLAETARRLREFTFSENPDATAMDGFCNKYSEVSQIGLDIGYNGLKGLGLENHILEGFSTVLGHVGTAVSVYQICRNDFRRQDSQTAGNTMKFTLNQCVSKLSSFCGTTAMYACLASVAIMDYSINKFATAAQSGRRDMYIRTYNAWMDDHPRHNGDWATLFKPYFSVFSNYTRNEIHDLIDEQVMKYCNAPWNDDWCALYFYNATGKQWTYMGGQNKALLDELANNKRNELYNGDIPTAVERLKAELAQEMFPKMRAQLDEYAYELNRGFNLILVDSSLIESKAKESQFAGYTVRFKDHPKQEFEGLQWDVVLDKEGHGEIGNRIGFLAYYDQKGILEVVSPKGKVVKVITLKNLKAGYTGKNGSQKDVDNYINIAPPQVVGVIATGKIACSSPTYKKGETINRTPLAIAMALIPNSVKVIYDENTMYVTCFKVGEDEDENYIVEEGTMISFSFDDMEGLETGTAKMKDLYLDATFSFSSGDDPVYLDGTKLRISSDLPIAEVLRASAASSGGGEGGDDEDDDDDFDLGAMLGAKWGVTCSLKQSTGLKIADYTITRKEWVYKWDSELWDDVLDHIDTHTFSLISDPSNEIEITVLFK